MLNLKLKAKYPALLKEAVPNCDDSEIVLNGLEEVIAHDADTGEFILHYIPKWADSKSLGPFLNEVKYPHSDRLSGLQTNSQIFGFSPRDALKILPCRGCKFGREYPKHNLVLNKLGQMISTLIKEKHEQVYREQCEALCAIHPNWIIPETVFNSGIINSNNQLMYHTDNQNIAGTISAMLTFKNKCSGGWLHLPEYEALLRNMDGSLLLFRGQKASHGVTPFTVGEGGYRFTVVWYTQQGLKHCAPDFAQELQVFNKKQNHKSDNIIGGKKK